MPGNLHVLARSRTFIPLVYNYCDRWCRHCPFTGRCLVFATEELLHTSSEPDREPVGASAPAGTCASEDDDTMFGHPLHFLARHYGRQARAYLSSLAGEPVPSTPPSPLEVIGWYSFLIGAKLYRALTSQRSAAGDPLYIDDCLGSAKVALLGIDRSLDAWRAIASIDDEARVGGAMELLEALRTGTEIRFPGARAFQRPGFDQPISARASESGDSGGGCGGARP